MKKIIIYIIAFTLLSSYALFYGAADSNAQQVSLGISPPLLTLLIKPGKSVLIAYNIYNYGDPAILKATVLPFEPKDIYGNIKIGNEFSGPVRFSLDNSFLQLDQPFFIKSQDSQQLLLRIRIPDGAPEGDYNYSLLVQSEPPPAGEGVNSSRSSATIGSNILITINQSGSTEVKARVSLFDVIPRFKFSILGKEYRIVDSNDQIPVVLVLQNKGLNRIQPQGSVQLIGNFGEKASYDLLPQNVLAQSERLISASSSANIEAPANTSFVLQGFFVGSYKLSTSINFGDGTPTIFGASGFIAIPFRFILGLIAALIISGFVIYRVRSDQDQINNPTSL